MSCPKCPWRFGEPCLVTDFVTPDNIGVREAVALLNGEDPDTTIENIAAWVRDDFQYPLDKKGNPCASGRLQRYQVSWHNWLFSKYVPYMWAYPNEVLLTKKGICIATANLCTSAYRAGGLDAWTVLGEVRRAKSDALVGYHAWTDVLYKEARTTTETTVEEKVNILFPADLTTARGSLWAQKRDLYYVPQSRFREDEYIAEGPLGGIMMELIGLPAGMANQNLHKTRVLAGLAMPFSILEKVSPMHIENERRKEELQVKTLIREAYRV